MRHPTRILLTAAVSVACACGGNGKGSGSTPPPNNSGNGGGGTGGAGGTGGTGGGTTGGTTGGGTGGTASGGTGAGGQSGGVTGGGTGGAGGGSTGASGSGTTVCTAEGCSTSGTGSTGGGSSGGSGGGGSSGGAFGGSTGGGSGGGTGGQRLPGGTVSGGQIPPSPGPAIVFSTYLGGSNADRIESVVVSANGDITVAGTTRSTDFPTTRGALEPKYPGNGSSAGFVARLSATGDLLWSTYVGGTKTTGGTDTQTSIRGVAVDGSGAVYVAGQTASLDMATPGSFQPTIAEGPEPFVAKISADGASLVWATYLGGAKGYSFGTAYEVAVDDAGAAYVSGISVAPDFPATPGAVGGAQPSNDFVVKLSADGKSVTYAIRLPDVSGIAVDGKSHQLAFHGMRSPVGPTTPYELCLLAADASAWKWCVVTAGPTWAQGHTVHVTSSGDVVVAEGGGGTSVVRVGADGKVVLDVPAQQSASIATDAAGDVWAAGTSYAAGLPTLDPIQGGMSGEHVYLSRIRLDGVTDTATYFGGSGTEMSSDVAADADGDAVVVGTTTSPDLPVASAFQSKYADPASTGQSPPGAQLGDGFIAVIRPFAARFTVPPGDDHHVSATVEANRPVIAMDVRVNGGGWNGMTQDATGAWTATIDVPPSSAVELRATGQGGVTSTSARLYWPYAEQFPPPGPFTVKFINPRGNGSWVEVDVAANEVVTGAAASVNGGAWQPMSQTAWGSWAAAISVPAGGTVQVRATGSDTSTVSSPQWSWPPP